MELNWFKILFWSGLATVFYAYIGYGIVLFFLVKLKSLFPKQQKTVHKTHTGHKVTFIVCAYNESEWIAQKVINSLQLRLPCETRFLFITDGSDDATTQRTTEAFQQMAPSSAWEVIHEKERKGKIAAFHRGMLSYGIWPGCPQEQHIIVSTDANTLLNPEALERMVAHFNTPLIGAVAGEKRIKMEEKDAASAAGEGIYWRYESLLKKWDADLWTVVGAAGELFAFRSSLYEAVPPDTLVEDFYLTMRIAQRGYRVAYEPEAYAVETSSASVSEEMKRKVRIAAGGLQAVVRLAPLLHIFRYGWLSFQYISHRVLRWTLAPLFLPLIFVSNVMIVQNSAQSGFQSAFYGWVLYAQMAFYLLAAGGYLLEQRRLKIKIFFIPYYFCLMNYAMYAGLVRLLRGRQSVIWDKAKRAV